MILVEWTVGSIIVIIVIAIVIGLIAAAITVGKNKSALISVQRKNEADIYAKTDTFKVDQSSDVFMYKKLEKQAKPKPQQSE